MNKRKPLSKKLRFEIFKRDSFKCQYCGATAPDVVLEVDHVHPVSKGGDNDILNLITSCNACNNGKRDHLLTDSNALDIQREQLEELNEKRQQLQMMIEWREGLKGVQDESLVYLEDVIQTVSNCTLNENGTRGIKKWLKKYPLNLLIECIEISADQYLEFDKDDNATNESFERFFRMTPRIAHHKQNNTELANGTYKDAFYCRGILRNRLSYVNEYECVRLLKQAIDLGIDGTELQEISKQVRNWTQFVDEMNCILGGENG